MAITTKIGDKGFTSILFGGLEVKDSPRMECCGALDELCSYLGLAKSIVKDKKIKDIIENIQNELFVICSEVAADKASVGKLKRRIKKKDITSLESIIVELERPHALKKNCFALPGENTVSATLDVARTIARKAERRIVSLKNRKELNSPDILVYMNRLSDLLFLLARSRETGKR